MPPIEREGHTRHIQRAEDLLVVLREQAGERLMSKFGARSSVCCAATAVEGQRDALEASTPTSIATMAMQMVANPIAPSHAAM